MTKNTITTCDACGSDDIARNPLTPTERICLDCGCCDVTATTRTDRSFERLPARITNAIEAAPKGCYQAALIDGGEAWSGSTLTGKAREWGARYAASREALLDRMNDTIEFGWIVSTEIVERRRVLTVLSPRGQRYVLEAA